MIGTISKTQAFGTWSVRHIEGTHSGLRERWWNNLCFIDSNKSCYHQRYSKKIKISTIIDKIIPGNNQGNSCHPYETKNISHAILKSKLFKIAFFNIDELVKSPI